MKKVWAKIRGFIVPTFLLGREKAVAAFLAPLVVVQLARWTPWIQFPLPVVEQVLLSVVTAITVHQTVNTR